MTWCARIGIWIGAMFQAVVLVLPAFGQVHRDVTVFAAASLTNALQDAGAAFAKSGAKSGGARVQIFVCRVVGTGQADRGRRGRAAFCFGGRSLDGLSRQRGLLISGTRRPLLGNRLALVVPADKPVQVEIMAGTHWLEVLPTGRIATGDPAHVPVGKYARQALINLGVWADVEPRLARADNVRNALVLVERGEAAAGSSTAPTRRRRSMWWSPGHFQNRRMKPSRIPLRCCARTSKVAPGRSTSSCRRPEARCHVHATWFHHSLTMLTALEVEALSLSVRVAALASLACLVAGGCRGLAAGAVADAGEGHPERGGACATRVAAGSDRLPAAADVRGEGTGRRDGSTTCSGGGWCSRRAGPFLLPA